MITRYAPNFSVRRLNRLNDLFEDLVSETEEARKAWAPAVDVKETKSEITLHAELPGMKQEDIEVEMVGDILTLKGQREQSSEENRDEYIRIERKFGAFQRSFTIGVPVVPEQIHASYKDGVLTVRIPKAPEVQPRKIEITNN